MNNLALLFIITCLYSIRNCNRLSLPVLDRLYKSKIQVYLDICFYAIEIFYFVWLLVISVFSFHTTWPLVLFTSVSWIFFRNKTKKNNLIFQSLKIIFLVLVYLQIKPL